LNNFINRFLLLNLQHGKIFTPSSRNYWFLYVASGEWRQPSQEEEKRPSYLSQKAVVQDERSKLLRKLSIKVGPNHLNQRTMEKEIFMNSQELNV